MLQLYLSFFTVQAINSVLNPFLQVMLRNSGYSYELIGVLFSLYEAFGILGPLVIGALADRTGKYRRSMMLCAIGCSLAFIPISLSSTLWLTILGLFLGAFCLRALFPLQDTIATNFLHSDAGKYTRLRSFGTLGYIVFNLIYASIPFPDVNSNRSILMALWIGCGLFLITTLFLPKRIGDDLQVQRHGEKVVVKEKWFDSAFLVGLMAIGFSRVSMSAVTSFLSLYMVEALGVTQLSLMTAIGAISEILMMLFSGYLLQKKKVEPITLIMCSAIGMFVRLMIYALFPSVTGLVCGQLLHSLGFGAMQPAAVLFVARRVKKLHRGVGMSMYISLATGIPAVIGSSLGGVLIANYGYRVMFSSLAMFSVISVIISISCRKLLTRPALESN